MSEPMSEERLAEIREDWAGGYAFRVEDQELVMRQHAAITDLLAEVERLRDQVDTLADEYDLLTEVERQRAVIAEQQAEIAAMLPVVEAVATMEREYSEDSKSWVLVPPLTNRNLFTVRLLEQARAYIAQHPATEG